MTTNDTQTKYPSLLQSAKDFIITVILWTCYIMGYILFFSPFYLYAFFFSGKPEEAFQKLNHQLHRVFFYLLRTIVPGVKWHVSKDVSAIRSSVIIANHLSFLDPILFVSLFERQKTIVRSDYFRLPVFGWILKTSGYIPSMTEDIFLEDMIDQIKKMKEYLSSGGNLFIFPEGTRSLNGRIGPFDKGAFRIARLCKAPIKIVLIRNTGKLFPPGKFLFNTCAKNVIDVELAGSLELDYNSDAFTLSGLMADTRSLMERKADL
ncbi:MAG TPA: lysophospholipid acyltransferase family protein [Syntrophales bacterium]|nr:lysophospholipid acyltransferase family protein [Syntrophales bacterium]